MMQKGMAALSVLALVALTASIAGQTNRPAGTTAAPPSSINASPTTMPPGPSSPGTPPLGQNENCPGGNCDLPHITIATPAPAPRPWPWQERIAWGANLVLVIVAYIGIMTALATLRRIERQGRYVEEAAQAAVQTANVTLKHVEALERAERPWILINVRTAIGIENGFSVVAINRGRSPARIISTIDEIVCVADETALSATPAYQKEPATPKEPIILLPEETIDLVSFSRDEVSQVCSTDELMKSVEDWESRIYLYGKVTYRSLAAPDDAAPSESSWCTWYIHGRQKSGMVVAGPPAYNKHT